MSDRESSSSPKGFSSSCETFSFQIRSTRGSNEEEKSHHRVRRTDRGNNDHNEDRYSQLRTQDSKFFSLSKKSRDPTTPPSLQLPCPRNSFFFPLFLYHVISGQHNPCLVYLFKPCIDSRDVLLTSTVQPPFFLYSHPS